MSVPRATATKGLPPFIWILVGIGGIGLLGLITLRLSFEARYIPSKAMTPTLQVGDRLIINKLAYVAASPQRGDVVIFNAPEAAMQILQQSQVQPQKGAEVFIKRIVGLPGETVAVKQGKVYVNSQPLQESYLTEPPEYQWGPVTVPANSYVVLGDNRNNSLDSHMWGFVSREQIIGKAQQIFLPPERVGPIR